MNIYEKMQRVKVDLQKKELKKTGENTFSKYKYYELGDFMPAINEICLKYKLFTSIDFSKEEAILTVINIEKTDEKLFYSSEMVKTTLKGCNEIQALGGVQTYQRRYLYMNAFEISENDYYVDGNNINEEIPKDDVEIEGTKKIDKLKKDLLDEAIEKNKISDEVVIKVLDNYGYSSTSEIEIKDYMNIVNDFKKVTGDN